MAPGRSARPGSSSTSWSTIGYERRHDPLLAPMDVDAFARALLAGQPTFPRYFARMRPINQAGPRLLGGVRPGDPRRCPATPSTRRSGAARCSSTRGHAEAHARGARAGLAVDPGRVVVRDMARLGRGRRPPGRPPRRRRRRSRRPVAPGAAHRVRLDRSATSTAGSTAGGGAGRPVEAGRALHVDPPRRALSAGGPEAPFVIDVRQAAEYEAGPRPGRHPHRRRRAARDARRSAARPADRDDLRERLSLERRRVAAACRAASSASRPSPAASPTGRRAGTPLAYGAGRGRCDVAGSAGPAGRAHAHSQLTTRSGSLSLSRPDPTAPERGHPEQHGVEERRRARPPTRPARSRPGRCGARPSAAGR